MINSANTSLFCWYKISNFTSIDILCSSFCLFTSKDRWHWFSNEKSMGIFFTALTVVSTYNSKCKPAECSFYWCLHGSWFAFFRCFDCCKIFLVWYTRESRDLKYFEIKKIIGTNFGCCSTLWIKSVLSINDCSCFRFNCRLKSTLPE